MERINTQAITRFKDTPLYRKGHEGELIVSDELKRRGYFVIPSYDYSGENDDKAPRMHGTAASLVLPDLDVCKDGRRVWVEVKTKEEATFHRNTQRLEHGISQRHYRDYKEVEKVSGCDVYLAVYEIKTGDVLMAKLSNLSKRERVYAGEKMSNGGMVFFAREDFGLFQHVKG